jgi:hypothetical protein
VKIASLFLNSEVNRNRSSYRRSPNTGKGSKLNLANYTVARFRKKLLEIFSGTYQRHLPSQRE